MKTGTGGVVNKREEAKRRKGGGVDGVFYCLCFINTLLYKCQLYHFPHHCFTTPLALSSGTRGGTSLSLVSLYCFSFSLNRFTLSPFFPLSFPLFPCLSHSLCPPPPCHGIPHPSLLSLFLSWRCVTSCPHETSQFSASSADE